MSVQEVVIAAPNGFCAGVVRAVDIVERALDKYGAPIYVRHEIVHNEYVVNTLRNKGAIFVAELDEVPSGSWVIFSAHGVSREVQAKAVEYGLNVIDATCPLVTRVHAQVEKMHSAGCEIVMIGHAGHPEVEGTMGQVKDNVYLVQNTEDARNLQVKNPEKLAYVTQTTLSTDDTADIINILQQRFPHLSGPAKTDICYATTNRQEAVKRIASEVDVIIVIGGRYSSNSLRLVECAQQRNVPAYRIGNALELEESWFVNCPRVGLTAGASTPDILLQEVLNRLKQMGAISVRRIEAKVERAVFAMPSELA